MRRYPLVMFIFLMCASLAVACPATARAADPDPTDDQIRALLAQAPTGKIMMRYSGEFLDPEPAYIKEGPPKGYDIARRLVMDKIFTGGQGAYNLWAGLQKDKAEFEKKQAMPQVVALTAKEQQHQLPLLLIDGKTTVAALIKTYGQPTHIGRFKPVNEKKPDLMFKVFWFGPVFIMAEAEDFNAVGGRPWLLLNGGQ